MPGPAQVWGGELGQRGARAAAVHCDNKKGAVLVRLRPEFVRSSTGGLGGMEIGRTQGQCETQRTDQPRHSPHLPRVRAAGGLPVVLRASGEPSA